jgi:hypothetical protein
MSREAVFIPGKDPGLQSTHSLDRSSVDGSQNQGLISNQ